jgi:hypothetical protein
MQRITSKNQAKVSIAVGGWFDTASRCQQMALKIGWLVNTNHHQVVHVRPDPTPKKLVGVDQDGSP